ncbi:MAG TPA: glucose-6-phosphate dehydrogenase assembly protein OpcA [Bryobacteraceae bacterium]|nr:glucose-6-phosphate dehydrogenase assembly protein OpcA [Bryobacteraceae bacterium]
MAAAVEEIRAEKLLKDLANVWKELNQTETNYAVVRACSMTLLVVTTGDGDEQDLAGTLGDLMHSHPCRYIVLRLVDTPEPEFAARVFAHCQLAFGRRQQLCCEQIEFTATRDRIPDFYAVALGLTVADLPVLLWVRDARLLAEPELAQILPLARPLIVDSAQFVDAKSGLADLEKRRQAGWRIKDLAWSRLTVWRETIAQMFETSGCRNLVNRVDRIEVKGRFGPTGSDVQYLAAWLSERVPGAAITATGSGVQRIRLVAGGQRLEVNDAGEALVATTLDGMVTRVPDPVRSDASLLEEELSILGPDPIYDATLRAVARLTH